MKLLSTNELKYLNEGILLSGYITTLVLLIVTNTKEELYILSFIPAVIAIVLSIIIKTVHKLISLLLNNTENPHGT